VRLVAALLLAAALAGCAAPRVRTYVNPVLDRDFPDPAVLRAPDGWFYAYATQSGPHGGILNIQVARSLDLVQWQYLGDALPQKPHWAATTQNFWAPHVLYDAGRETYFMYYSGERDGAAPSKCLAVATARSPAGPFVDSGEPLLCGQGIEHIDPMAFDDPQTGRRLLYWGSGAWPIRVRELAPDRLRFLAGSEATPLLFADQREYRSLIEGAWLRQRDGYYYLFYSGDRCCERGPRYAVMVARSASAFGPFEEMRGVVLANNGFWVAPGHNSVATDDAGDDWMLYHAIDAEGDYLDGRRRLPWRSARVMLIDRLEYRDGWPRIAGDQPSTGPRPAPAIAPR
jgi:arabinan endo-1,5-alpha-L-arabinosidase